MELELELELELEVMWRCRQPTRKSPLEAQLEVHREDHCPHGT